MVDFHTHRGGCALTQAAEYGGGAPAPRYGEPGELCAAGCGTVLRRTNPWDTCAACECAGHVGNPRPTVKRHEEAKVSKKLVRQAAIADYLDRNDGWHTQAELAAACGISCGSIDGILAEMDVARRSVRKGGSIASLRYAESEKTAPGPQAAPAPAAHREQSAEVAAEVPPVPSPPAADTEHEAVMSDITELELHVDLELYVLQLLADLDPEARERVLQFAVAKWWLK